MGKSKKSFGSFLGAISRCLKVPHSPVQTIIHKYKHHGNVHPSYRALVRNVHINPRTKAEDIVTIYSHSAKKQPLIQKKYKKATQGQKPSFLETCPVW
uniref:Uncharacterized protein n=1 Tax=Periophthalmus magnuspinnatus TaxID=409849 RepID=A0A3B3ZBM7_9GOBI